MQTKVVLKPGLAADETELASKGGFISSNRVRFWRGSAEALGGWQLKVNSGFQGVARGAHEWVDLQNRPVIAWGTSERLYAMIGGALLDITPSHSEGVLMDPFYTTAGSKIVHVGHTKHGLREGDLVTFVNAPPTGGLTLNGTFVVDPFDEDHYLITAETNATGTATSGTGSTVDYSVALAPGLVSSVFEGFGDGPYGEGPWGGAAGAAIVDAEPRTWSLDNFGENLLAVPRGGGLYEWRPTVAGAEVLRNGTFNTDAEWDKGTGWTIGSGAASKTPSAASALLQTPSGGYFAGGIYRLTFNATITAGSVKFQVNSGVGLYDAGEASTPITRSGGYSRLVYLPWVTSFGFWGDSLFNGTIDNVSLKPETRAARVKEAPARIGFMFVDPNRFVVAASTDEYDGDFNANLLRWSDQENARQWTPQSTNLSGELPIASGSRILSGIASRQQNLIWTDSALFSMTFTSDESVFSQRLLGTNCGIIGPNAAVNVNGAAFWMAPTGFFAFQGSAPQRLDCSVERQVYDNIDKQQAHKVYAGLNSKFNEVWWMYPDVRDGIECSRVVVFNTTEQTWATHIMDRTCWLDGELGAQPLGFASTGQVYEHEVGHDANGSPLDWHLTTGAFDVAEGENLMIVDEMIPDMKAQLGLIDYELTPKLYPNADPLPTSYHRGEPGTKVLRMRRKGRQMSMTLRGIGTPSYFRWGAPRLNVRPAAAKE